MTLLLFAGAICAGCGGGPDGEVRLRGEVKYDGQPVPEGRIDFVPAGEAPNAGAGGYAIIETGQFDTRQNGRGPSPGTYLARINGFDGSPPTDPESMHGKLLFQGYETEVVVSADQDDLVFAVPKQ